MRLSLFRRTAKKLLNFWEILKDGQSETKIRVNLSTMAERKTKMIEGPVLFNGPLESLSHYNKNQIITCTCESCIKQFTIKFSSLRKKTSLLCKSCSIKLHTPYSSNGIKISKAKKYSNSRLSEKERYERYVAPQLNRSEEAKRKSIESYRSTVRSRSQEETDLMKLRMRSAKAAMTDAQRKEREQKFLKSFYESQGDRIRQHAEMILKQRGYSFSEQNLLYACECRKCGAHWLWSPVKKLECHTICPYCPKCFKDNRPKYEDDICSILDELNVGYLRNDRKVLKGKELDCYIPSARTAIEFDGIYWHNNSLKTYEKHKMLKEKNIFLLNIFENEYDRKKIKSILAAKLHKSENIIHARKCKLKEISNDAYRSFCNENHIQNYAAAKVRLGLFYNDELVQIMSFSKPRFNKKYEWEMIRECTKCGYGVVGGKERLFKNFIRMHSPRSVISYCDKRHFTGESYLKLGMQALADSGQSFIYTNGRSTYSRMQCQKFKLKKLLADFDEHKTGYENMTANGYFRLYDFGQKVFVWTS